MKAYIKKNLVEFRLYPVIVCWISYNLSVIFFHQTVLCSVNIQKISVTKLKSCFDCCFTVPTDICHILIPVIKDRKFEINAF